MIIRYLIILVSFLMLSSFETGSTEKRFITFLRVDLVCGAASDIGCGSRSKPILIDLEKQSDIAEAWLNRQGTIIAVVWNDNQDANENLLRQILKKHKKSGTILGDEKSKILEEKFRSERWYRTDEVDELSTEEAGRIAENIMNVIVSQDFIGENESAKMKSEIETLIRTELLSLEDVSLLDQRSYYKSWENGIKEIAKSYMPQEQVDEIRLFAMSPFLKYSIYGGISLVLIIVVTLIYRWRRKRLNKI